MTTLQDYLSQIEQEFKDHEQRIIVYQQAHQAKQSQLRDEIETLEAQSKSLRNRIAVVLSKGELAQAQALKLEADGLPLKIAEIRLRLTESQSKEQAELIKLGEQLHSAVHPIAMSAYKEFFELEIIWGKISGYNNISSSALTASRQNLAVWSNPLNSARAQVEKAKAELSSKYQVVA